MATPVRRPVVEGLMEELSDGPRLIATRCAGCGQVYFPRAATCRNPGCNSSTLEETRLSQEGVLYSYTVQHYRPPPLFRMDDWEPYAIGLVHLTEGVRIMGMLSGVEHDQIRIGQAVKLVTGMLYTNEDGVDVVTYMFAPAEQGGSRL